MSMFVSKDVMTAAAAILLAAAIPAHAQFRAGQPGLLDPGIAPVPDQPGLYTAATQTLVEPGDYAKDNWPPCQTDANDELRYVGRALLSLLNVRPELKIAVTILAGPVIDGLEQAAKKSGGDIGFLLFPDRTATCKPLAVALPIGATVKEIRYYAGDGDRGTGQCALDGNSWMVCPVGFSGWESTPQVDGGFTIGQENQVVGAVFKNWSHDRARWASLVVLFEPPVNWHPRVLQMR